MRGDVCCGRPANAMLLLLSQQVLDEPVTLLFHVQVIDSYGKVIFQQPPPGTVQMPIDTLPAGRTLLQNYQLRSQNANFYLIPQSRSTVPPSRWCRLVKGSLTMHASLQAPGQRTLCKTMHALAPPMSKAVEGARVAAKLIPCACALIVGHLCSMGAHQGCGCLRGLQCDAGSWSCKAAHWCRSYIPDDGNIVVYGNTAPYTFYATNVLPKAGQCQGPFSLYANTVRA